MKKLCLLSSLLWLLLNTAYSQIDPSISTPADLQESGITILTKTRLDDGTIVIRYKDKQGRTIQRRTHPSKPGEKQEWDEANPPADAGNKAGKTAAVGGAAVGGTNEVKAGAGALPGGSQKPPEGTLGEDPRAGTQGESALKGAGEGAKSVGQGASGNPDPLKQAADAAKKAAKAAEEITTTAKGTGQTTGIIANITVTNNNDFPVEIQPQTFFIPSGGQYQSYVGRIPPGITVPPKGTADVPVNGVCTDVRTPPVPTGTDMPPGETWVPVGVSPPPGAGVPPSTVPVPVNPPGGSTTPDVVTIVPVIGTVPVPKFNPTDIPHITTTSGFKPGDTPDPEIIITWPKTDTPVGGTLDPKANPEVFAPVIVSVLEEIEDAVDVVQKSGTFPTPFTGNPEKERESIIQQTFWIVNAAITGNDYTKEDFTKNAHDQFQQTTGKTVASLPDEQKEEVNTGISDFWNTFLVTGVVAKVISAETPGIDTGSTTLPVMVRDDPLDEWAGFDEVKEDAATGQDDVTDKEEDEPVFKCVCPDSISFDLEIKRGETAVLDSKYAAAKNPTGNDVEINVKVEKLRFGDKFDIKISDVDINCQCAQTTCDVFWTFVTIDNNNCSEIERDGKTYVKIETKADNAKDQTIFSECRLHGICGAPGCEGCECGYVIKLTFSDSKSK